MTFACLQIYFSGIALIRKPSVKRNLKTGFMNGYLTTEKKIVEKKSYEVKRSDL